MMMVVLGRRMNDVRPNRRVTYYKLQLCFLLPAGKINTGQGFQLLAPSTSPTSQNVAPEKKFILRIDSSPLTPPPAPNDSSYSQSQHHYNKPFIGRLWAQIHFNNDPDHSLLCIWHKAPLLPSSPSSRYVFRWPQKCQHQQ